MCLRHLLSDGAIVNNNFFVQQNDFRETMFPYKRAFLPVFTRFHFAEVADIYYTVRIRSGLINSLQRCRNLFKPQKKGTFRKFAMSFPRRI